MIMRSFYKLIIFATIFSLSSCFEKVSTIAVCKTENYGMCYFIDKYYEPLEVDVCEFKYDEKLNKYSVGIFGFKIVSDDEKKSKSIKEIPMSNGKPVVYKTRNIYRVRVRYKNAFYDEVIFQVIDMNDEKSIKVIDNEEGILKFNYYDSLESSLREESKYVQ